jgi:hypothetical protein
LEGLNLMSYGDKVVLFNFKLGILERWYENQRTKQ